MIEKVLLLDRLREDYADEIIKIINFCQFEGKDYLDIYSLNSKLRALSVLSVQTDLSEEDWFELIYELTPDTYDQLSLCRKTAA